MTLQPQLEALSSPETSATTAPTASQEALIKSALEAYTQSQQALQAGDWQAYGTAQKRLGTILKQLTETEQ